MIICLLKNEEWFPWGGFGFCPWSGNEGPVSHMAQPKEKTMIPGFEAPESEMEAPFT